MWGVSHVKHLIIRCLKGHDADYDAPTCRICYEGDSAESGGKLVAPCNCRGTGKYIHLDCLQTWQGILGPHNKRRDICPTCKSRYRDLNTDLLKAAPRWSSALADRFVKAEQALVIKCSRSNMRLLKRLKRRTFALTFESLDSAIISICKLGDSVMEIAIAAILTVIFMYFLLLGAHHGVVASIRHLASMAPSSLQVKIEVLAPTMSLAVGRWILICTAERRYLQVAFRLGVLTCTAILATYENVMGEIQLAAAQQIMERPVRWGQRPRFNYIVLIAVIMLLSSLKVPTRYLEMVHSSVHACRVGGDNSPGCTMLSTLIFYLIVVLPSVRKLLSLRLAAPVDVQIAAGVAEVAGIGGAAGVPGEAGEGGVAGVGGVPGEAGEGDVAGVGGALEVPREAEEAGEGEEAGVGGVAEGPGEAGEDGLGGVLAVAVGDRPPEVAAAGFLDGVAGQAAVAGGADIAGEVAVAAEADIADEAAVAAGADIAGEAVVAGGGEIARDGADVVGEAALAGGVEIAGEAAVAAGAEIADEAAVVGGADIVGEAAVDGGAGNVGEAAVDGGAGVFGEAGAPERVGVAGIVGVAGGAEQPPPRQKRYLRRVSFRRLWPSHSCFSGANNKHD